MKVGSAHFGILSLPPELAWKERFKIEVLPDKRMGILVGRLPFCINADASQQMRLRRFTDFFTSRSLSLHKFSLKSSPRHKKGSRTSEILSLHEIPGNASSNSDRSDDKNDLQAARPSSGSL